MMINLFVAEVDKRAKFQEYILDEHNWTLGQTGYTNKHLFYMSNNYDECNEWVSHLESKKVAFRFVMFERLAAKYNKSKILFCVFLGED